MKGGRKMAEIKLNQEMICALQNCKDVKSFMALAKSRGLEISEEQAEKIFDTLQNAEMSDEELEKVAGGFFKDLWEAIKNGGGNNVIKIINNGLGI